MKTKDISTEKRILEAAKQIFQTKGMNGARMQEIADLAGINKAMLHYYFRNKQLLFEAVFKNSFMQLAPQLNTILNDDSSIEDKIRNFTYNYISFISKHPYLPSFIIQELNRNPEFISKIKEENKGYPNLNKFRDQINTAVKNGQIKPIKAEQLFINTIALSIFPFVASPLIKTFININDTTFNEVIEERKTEVAEFIINSIKK